MNIGSVLCRLKIDGISPIELIGLINEESYRQTANNLILQLNKKMKPLKCVGDYYRDPVTGKKVKTTSLNNPCHNIKNAFSIDTSIGCHNCHKCMASKLMSGEVELLKKKC